MPDPAMDGAGEGMETNDHEALVRLAVLETRLNGTVENIALQAQEYERRLTELNHAHARATEDRNKYVGVDLFYSKIDEIAKWRSEMDQWRSKIIGIAIGVGSFGGLIGGAIAGIISRIIK